MFPSNNCNINEPVYYNYNNQSGFHTRPFPCNDITSNSKQDLDLEDTSLPLVGIHLDDHDFFLQQCCDFLLPLRPDNIIDNTTTTVPVVNMLDSTKTQVNLNSLAIDRSAPTATLQMQIPTKRALKKDRHSKINTARGLRDRRMRLSLEVARPFFNLQDKLGYDKASKTVEWLLLQAEPEIKKLERGLSQSQMNYNCSFSTTVGTAAKSASSTSECEVVSGSIKSRGKPSIKGKKTRQSRKFTVRPLTRDLREKARARARERTSYKKIMIMCNRNIIENNDLNNFFENGEESGTGSQNKNNSSEVDVPGKVDEPSSHAQLQDLPNHDNEYAVDDPSVIQAKWSPSSIFNYSHNMGILQEHQFADFQLFSKQYEA